MKEKPLRYWYKHNPTTGHWECQPVFADSLAIDIETPAKKSTQWFAQAQWIEQSKIAQNWLHDTRMTDISQTKITLDDWVKQVNVVVNNWLATADISQYVHERLDEPDLIEDEGCYCFSVPLDTCPEHGLLAKRRREHEEG